MRPAETGVPKQCSYWTRAPLDCQRQNNHPTPCRLLLNVWGPIQNVWGLIHFVCSSQYVHGARSTVLYCTVLYCAHLVIFMQYTGVSPTIQLEIPTFHSIYAQDQLGILALKSTNHPELGSKRPPTPNSQGRFDCVECRSLC